MYNYISCKEIYFDTKYNVIFILIIIIIIIDYYINIKHNKSAMK